MTGRVLWITGAAGFIGQQLARSVGEDWTAWGLDVAPASGQVEIAADRYIADRVSAEGLDGLLERAGEPHAIVHLAGGSAVGPSYEDPQADFEATVGSTAILLDWMRRRSPVTAIVVASSAAVYGAGYTRRIAEGALRSPVSPYGVHKAVMEDVALSYRRHFGIDVRIARLFSVYGPGLRKQILWDLCRKLARGPIATLEGTGREFRDFVHAADATAALLRLAGSVAAGTVVNVGGGSAVTIAALADMLCRHWRQVTGRPADAVFSGRMRPGDPASLLADGTLGTHLGIAPCYTLDDGLADYVRWFVGLGETR